MKYFLTILLFSTLSAHAQPAFVMGQTYGFTWVVEYPPNSQRYWSAISPTPFKATKTPDKDPKHWGVHTPTPVVDDKPAPLPEKKDTVVIVRRDTVMIPSPIASVTRATIDSLNNKLKQFEALPFGMDQLTKLITSMGKDVQGLKSVPMSTYRIYKGVSPVKIVNDSLFYFKKFIDGPDFKVVDTDSTLQIIKR